MRSTLDKGQIEKKQMICLTNQFSEWHTAAPDFNRQVAAPLVSVGLRVRL
jgi:hypothetical protein